MDEIKSLSIQINSKCNLHCKHCVVDHDPSIEGDADLATLIKAVNYCLSFGLESVDISLKEPLIYKYIIEFLQYLKQKKIAVELLTNGTQLSDEKISQLIYLISCLHISLDGITEESNDYIRGTGVFEKVVDGIKRFQNVCSMQEVYIPIILKLTLNSANISSIDEMNSFFQELGVDEVVINPIQIDGNAIKYQNLQLSNELFLNAVEKLIEDYSKKQYDFSLKFPQLMPMAYIYYNLKYQINQSVTKPGCMSDRRTFSLNSKGILYSCALNCETVDTDFGGIEIPHINLRENANIKKFLDENSRFHNKMLGYKKQRAMIHCLSCYLYKYCNLCPLMSTERYYFLLKRCYFYKSKLEELVEIIINNDWKLRLKTTACVRINCFQDIEFVNYYHGTKIHEVNIPMNAHEKVILESVLKKITFSYKDLGNYNNLNYLKNFLFRLVLTDCFELLCS